MRLTEAGPLVLLGQGVDSERNNEFVVVSYALTNETKRSFRIGPKYRAIILLIGIVVPMVTLRKPVADNNEVQRFSFF